MSKISLLLTLLLTLTELGLGSRLDRDLFSPLTNGVGNDNESFVPL